MTSIEAKKILNEYRNRNYNSTLRDELELAKAIDTVLPKYVALESQNYIYNLENIQLKTVLFNYIADVYEELDSLMARLQDNYNNGIEFEQKEEDRLIIGNILDIFTNLEDALSLKKAMKNFLEGETK